MGRDKIGMMFIDIAQLARDLKTLNNAISNLNNTIRKMTQTLAGIMELQKDVERKASKKLSIRDHMVDILKVSRKPLHYRNITNLIKKRGYRFHRKDPERSVYITLNRNPHLFKKIRPATYKLQY